MWNLLLQAEFTFTLKRSGKILKLRLRRPAVWNKTALIPPKVNHRLRSFNGSPHRMVDFLGRVDDMAAVRAAKSQPLLTKFQRFAASDGWLFGRSWWHGCSACCQKSTIAYEVSTVCRLGWLTFWTELMTRLQCVPPKVNHCRFT